MELLDSFSPRINQIESTYRIATRLATTQWVTMGKEASGIVRMPPTRDTIYVVVGGMDHKFVTIRMPLAMLQLNWRRVKGGNPSTV